MQVVIGEFETQAQAEDALLRLRAAGYAEDRTALVDNRPPAAERVETGAEVTAVAPERQDVVVTPSGARDAREAAVMPDGAPVHAAEDTPRAVAPAEEEVRLPSEPATPPQVSTLGHSEDQAVENTALGSALGAFAGGAVGGPLGIALGVVAGGAIAAWASRWRADSAETRRSRYAGQFLLAVEVDGPAAEVHRVLDEAGAAHVHVEPL